MANDNVIEHPAVTWEKAKEINDRIEKRTGDLINDWRALGECLNVLRAAYKADQEFGIACFEHGIERTRQHRNAAMWLARLSEAQLFTLREYFPDAIHPKTLQDKCREFKPEWLSNSRDVIEETARKTDFPSGEAGVPSGDTATKLKPNSKMAKKIVSQPASTKILDSTTDEKQTEARPAKTDKQILRKYFCGNSQYSGRIAWLIAPHRALIAQWIRDGILSTPMTKSADGVKRFTMRALVPQLSIGFIHSIGLRNDHAQSDAMKRIFTLAPDVFRMRDALGEKIADKQACESWWQDDKRKQAMAQQEASNTNPNTKSANSLALVYLREGQQFGAKQPRPGAMNQKIIVCGEQLWPPTKFCTYSFADVWCAYNLWRQLDGDIARTGDDAESRGRGFMPYSIWLTAASKSFAAAWTAITYAEYQHPEKMLECQCPDQVR